MKLAASTKKRLSSVGSTDKGFRQSKGGIASSRSSSNSSPSTRRDLSTESSDPTTPLRRYSTLSIPWKTISISHDIFRQLAATNLRRPGDMLPSDTRDLLHLALIGYSQKSLHDVATTLDIEEAPSSKVRLIGVIVELLLNREHLLQAVQGDSTSFSFEGMTDGSVVTASPKQKRKENL